jgi:hypothetical protein
MVNSPFLEKKIVVFIIGIIIGIIVFSLINNSFPSFLKCSDTEKFTQEEAKPEPPQNIQINSVPAVQPIISNPMIKMNNPSDNIYTNQPSQNNNLPSGYDSNKSFACVNMTQGNQQPVANNLSNTNNNNNIPLPCTNDDDKNYASFQPSQPSVPLPTQMKPNIAPVMQAPVMQAPAEKEEEEYSEDESPTEMENNKPPQVSTVPISNKSIRFYNFNTSWCGWSTKFQPEWDKFMNIVRSNPKLNNMVDVQDVKCDNDANKQLCAENDVQGFPTVIIKYNDKTINYDGPRTVDGLMDVINKIGNI